MDTERYALPIESVANVLPEGAITRVPGASAYVRGVANVRGSLLAVVDLPAMLSLPRSREGEGYVLVVHSSLGDVGLLVDWAEDVLSLAPEQVEPGAGALAEPQARFIQGRILSAPAPVHVLRLEQLVAEAHHG